MPLNVRDLGVDMLSFSAHKFYGPKGCGVLYVKSGVKIERLVVGGEQERGLRGGTVNVPSVVGLASAYSKNAATMYELNKKIAFLRDLFLSEISSLKGVHQNGEGEGMLPSVLNLRFDGVRNEDFLYNMDLKGICVAAGSACASASVKPSHVLTAMGLTESEARSSVRFSFGKNNTEEEIRFAAKATVEIVQRLRKF
jgi:cysteine desulfurase